MKLSAAQKGALLTILGATCWGISGVLGEYLLNVSKINSMWVISTRMFYAGLILITLLFFKDKTDLFRVFKNKKDIIRLINFSFFGLLICQGTYFLAIKYTNAGMATVIQFTGPVMIMAFYCIVNRRAPLPREVIAKLNISSVGLFWGILSAIGLASYNISSFHLTAKYGVMPTIAWGLLISGVVIYFGTGSY